MTSTNGYVWREEQHGTMRTGKKGVLLDGIVIGFWQGESPEAIRRSYPALSLEEVYGAIAYYLANRDEVDQYLERQEAAWERLRLECEKNPSPVVERLRALKATMQAAK